MTTTRTATRLISPQTRHARAGRTRGTVMQVGRFRVGLDRARLLDRANLVRIPHDDGTMALYAHLAPTARGCALASRCSQASRSAVSGNTGYSSGPHLHFVVQVNRGLRLVSVPFRMPGSCPLIAGRGAHATATRCSISWTRDVGIGPGRALARPGPLDQARFLGRDQPAPRSLERGFGAGPHAELAIDVPEVAGYRGATTPVPWPPRPRSGPWRSAAALRSRAGQRHLRLAGIDRGLEMPQQAPRDRGRQRWLPIDDPAQHGGEHRGPGPST